MAGPGGREVARVSARVVPNTSGFDRELKSYLDGLERGLKVKIELEVDDKGARGKVDAFATDTERQKVEIGVGADTTQAAASTRAYVAEVNGQKVTLDVGADTARALAEGRAAVVRLDGEKATIDVGADTTKAYAQTKALTTAINREHATVKVDVDVDKAGLGGIGGGKGGGGALAALKTGFEGLLSVGSKLPSVFGSVGGALGDVFESGSKAFGITTKLAGGLTKMGGAGVTAAGGAAAAVTAIIAVMAKITAFGAKASGVAAILGAVTFAIGAVGAAASALPAVLLGASAAAGTVYLGLDGIKKAAEAAKPALETLKSQVSDVFKRELTPAFEQVAKILPQLRSGFEFVAVGVSNLIKNLLGVFTSVEGVQQLQQVLGNTRVMIETMTPGVVTLVRTLLEIATVGPVFREIGLLVSDLSLQFAGLFARFAQGGEASLMVQSFTALRQVVSAAVGAFSELLVGATEFFVQAAPGVTEFFGSLQRTLAKIDFPGLGGSFGIFAEAVGRFFESVPQSTWDTLSASLREVADEFAKMSKDPAIQAFFNGLIRTIPTAIRTFADFLAMVRNVADFLVTGFATAKVAVLGFASQVVGSMANAAAGVAAFLNALPFIPQGMKDAATNAVVSLTSMKTGIDTQLAGAVVSMEAKKGDFGAAGTALGKGAADGAKAGIAPMPGTMGAGAADAASRVRGQGQNATTAGNAVGSGAAGGARAGIAPMPGDMGNTATDAKNRIGQQEGGFRQVGAQVAAGTAKGIASGRSGVISAAIEIAKAAWNAAKRFLGIASPSRLFRYQIGERITQGWALGLEGGASAVIGAMSRLVERVVGTARAGAYLRAGQNLGTQLATGITTGLSNGMPAAVSEVDRVSAAVSALQAHWDSGVQYEDGSTSTGRPAFDSPDDFVKALEQLQFYLDPQGVARLARRGDVKNGRR